jgi:hypothetical protein
MKKSILLVLVALAFIACDKKSDKPGAATADAAKGDAATTASTDAPRPFKSKSGVIEYKMDFMGDQHITTYYDDYGAKQASYVNTSLEMAGQKFNSTNVSINANGEVITYDVDKKTGTRMKVPASSMGAMGATPGTGAMDFEHLTDKQKQEYHIEEIGNATILDKDAKGYSMEVMGMKMKVWVWEGIPLKTEMNMGGKDAKPMVMEATKIETDVDVAADKFTVPSDVKLSDAGAGAGTTTPPPATK